MSKIGILSGKGGTGKTFISVNLASVIKNSTYIDCDVEEPNGRLFLKPKDIKTEFVKVKNPVINNDLCVGCRKCVTFCEFNALAFVDNNVLLIDNLCHSCGGCAIICPQEAITEKDKVIGKIEIGKNENTTCVTGLLKVSVAAGVPIITQSLEHMTENTIVDCPPGSSCEVMESIDKVDYCIIVVEPTKFSYHNYLMVKELVTTLKKPYGVVINKYEKDSGIEFDDNILTRISFDPQIAKELSIGEIPVKNHQELKDTFVNLYNKITKEISND
jgi:MinD superfamily P-loop ATPase